MNFIKLYTFLAFKEWDLKKTIKLKTEYKYDFHLFGIMSKSKEYALSWSINESSGMELKKMDDLEIDIKNEQKLTISNYQYQTESSQYYLVGNRLVGDENNGHVLLAPSLKTFDYLLKVETENEEEEVSSIYSLIRNAVNVESIVKLDVSKVKEKENFFF